MCASILLHEAITFSWLPPSQLIKQWDCYYFPTVLVCVCAIYARYGVANRHHLITKISKSVLVQIHCLLLTKAKFYKHLQVDLINEPFAHLTCFATATPQPTVGLANSTLQSLSISWSVTSPQDVTNYMVFWWKESAEISKSVALDDTKFVIEGLLSNTAYHVVVLASGPLWYIYEQH